MRRVRIVGDCWLSSTAKAPGRHSVHCGLPPDLFVVNLECASPAGEPRFRRRALLPLDATRLGELRAAGTTVCVAANNHVTDFGPDGLMTTLQAVRDMGFASVGAGQNLQDARRPFYTEFGGRRIAILAYCDTRDHVGGVAATENSPGIAPLDPDMIEADLRAASSRADDTWLFLHWGWEYLRYPCPEERGWARRFAKAGATLVVGMHPHVARGWETVDGTPTFYSLGNFLFPPIALTDGAILRWDRVSQLGLGLNGTLSESGWTWDPYPIHIGADGTPGEIPAPDAQRILLSVARRLPLMDHLDPSGYRWLHRREAALRALRRIGTMTWGERARLPWRVLSAGWRGLVSKRDSARVAGR